MDVCQVGCTRSYHPAHIGRWPAFFSGNRKQMLHPPFSVVASWQSKLSRECEPGLVLDAFRHRAVEFGVFG